MNNNIIKKINNSMVSFLNIITPKLFSNLKIIRYIISGGTAAVVDLGALFLFTHVFGVWYLLSVIIAYLVAFFVSFTLQKFWTFRDHSLDNYNSQFITYLIVTLISFAINTILVFILVEKFAINYMISQFIAGIVLALMNYFLYQILIFKKEESLSING